MRSWLLAVLVLVVATSHAPSHADSLKDAAAKAGFSGTVTTANAKGSIQTLVFGLADEPRKRPHTTAEIWPWASVTKQVVAVLAMQEVERGRLQLDSPVSDYLPEFSSANASRITVRQLLQHTSGLPNPESTPPSASGVPGFYLETGPTISSLARSRGFCAGEAIAEPGAGFSYNNCDYLVLGALLQRITGESYENLVRRRIAELLGLKTVHPAEDRLTTGYGRVVAYETAGKAGPLMNLATLGPAGDLVGSAADLVSFDRALMQGKLLSTAGLQQLWKGEPKFGYAALGAWAFPASLKDCAEPVDLVERRGEFGGVQVRNIFAPKLGKILVIFTNRGDTIFGEIWQGRGLTYDLFSAAFCSA